MPKTAAPGAQAALPPDSVLRKLRVSLIQRATLLWNGQEEPVFTMDVGLAGVFVERTSPLPLGETVTLSFVLPGNAIPVSAACRVAWWHAPHAPLVSKSLPAGLGLEFVSISEADRARLRELLLEHWQRDPRARQFVRQWPDEPGEPTS
jgi:Tfp pilus assembly protein PilZ